MTTHEKIKKQGGNRVSSIGTQPSEIKTNLENYYDVKITQVGRFLINIIFKTIFVLKWVFIGGVERNWEAFPIHTRTEEAFFIVTLW